MLLNIVLDSQKGHMGLWQDLPTSCYATPRKRIPLLAALAAPPSSSHDSDDSFTKKREKRFFMESQQGQSHPTVQL